VWHKSIDRKGSRPVYTDDTSWENASAIPHAVFMVRGLSPCPLTGRSVICLRGFVGHGPGSSRLLPAASQNPGGGMPLWPVFRPGDFTTNRWIGATIRLEGPQEPRHHGTFEAWFFKGREEYVQERVEAARKERERAEAAAKKKGKSFDDGGISEKVSEPSAIEAQLDYYRESSSEALKEALEERANGRNRNQNRGSERSGKTGRRINAPHGAREAFFDTANPAGIEGKAVGLSREGHGKTGTGFQGGPGGRQGWKKGHSASSAQKGSRNKAGRGALT